MFWRQYRQRATSHKTHSCLSVVQVEAMPTFTCHTALTFSQHLYTTKLWRLNEYEWGTEKKIQYIRRKISTGATLSTTNPTRTALQPGTKSTDRLSYSSSSNVLQLHRLGPFLLLSSLRTSPFCYGALMFVTSFTRVHQGSYTFTENAHTFQPFRFTLILKLCQRSSLPSCIFPSGF